MPRFSETQNLGAVNKKKKKKKLGGKKNIPAFFPPWNTFKYMAELPEILLPGGIVEHFGKPDLSQFSAPIHLGA